MPIEFACRTPDCDGVVQGAPSAESLACAACGRVYRLNRKPSRDPGPRKSAGARSDENNEPETSEPESSPPPDPATSETPRRKRRKRRRKSAGVLSGIGAFLSANRMFLLTRVLPLLAIVVGVVVIGARMAMSNKAAEQTEKLIATLWEGARGANPAPSAKPYVRGQLAILETQAGVKFELQDSGRPQHWLNHAIEPPLDDQASVGSVILVEWKVQGVAARNSAGRTMHVGGQGDPVMLKKWSCRVKLVDLKRRLVVYEAHLGAPDRTFNEGERVLVTPSTEVSAEQLAAEFNRIRGFPQIALDAEPPEGEPPAAEPPP